MRVTVGGALVAGAAILALAAPAAAVASSADATQGTDVAHAEAGGALPDAGRATDARQATDAGQAEGPRAAAAIHVVLAGIGGLRWSDISPTTTPALWRLARRGSVGSLVVSGIHPRTCPAGIR